MVVRHVGRQIAEGLGVLKLGQRRLEVTQSHESACLKVMCLVFRVFIHGRHQVTSQRRQQGVVVAARVGQLGQAQHRFVALLGGALTAADAL